MKRVSSLEVQAVLLARSGIRALRVDDLDDGFLLQTNLTTEDLVKMVPRVKVPGLEVVFVGVGPLEGAVVLREVQP